MFKSVLQINVAKILRISSSAVKLMSTTATKRRQLAQDMERLPSLEAIGVDTIYIVTATSTNISAITYTIKSKNSQLVKAFVAAGFLGAAPQSPSISTFTKLSPTAAPSEISAALSETTTHYAVLACTLSFMLLQIFTL